MLLFVQAEAGRDFEYPPTIVFKGADDFVADLVPTAEDEAELLQQADQARLVARRLQALAATLSNSTPEPSSSKGEPLLSKERGAGQPPWPPPAPIPTPESPPDPQAAEAAAAARPTFIPLPEVLIAEFSARYRFGPVFIRSQGGVSETWDLLAEAPTSTEQVLVPESADEPIVTVEVPEAEGPVFETQVAGALDVALVLTGRGAIGSVARGWAGGRSVMWGDDEVTCVRYAIATDTEADQDRLLKTFGRWADAAEDRVAVVEGDLIVATSCAPYVP
ncbi:hypothetical protein GQR58_029922 [Nymphon striatum]|nr:hypothetical protein GQR58_029922 [Nymphon striatum]